MVVAGDILSYDYFFIADDAVQYDDKAFDKHVRKQAELLKRLRDLVDAREPYYLNRLEKFYGKPKPPHLTEPYEMILYINCGYPATDTSCAKAFDALKRSIGLRVDDILAAPKEKLTEVMRLGGIVPEPRAVR